MEERAGRCLQLRVFEPFSAIPLPQNLPRACQAREDPQGAAHIGAKAAFPNVFGIIGVQPEPLPIFAIRELAILAEDP